MIALQSQCKHACKHMCVCAYGIAGSNPQLCYLLRHANLEESKSAYYAVHSSVWEESGLRHDQKKASSARGTLYIGSSHANLKKSRMNNFFAWENALQRPSESRVKHQKANFVNYEYGAFWQFNLSASRGYSLMLLSMCRNGDKNKRICVYASSSFLRLRKQSIVYRDWVDRRDFARTASACHRRKIIAGVFPACKLWIVTRPRGPIGIRYIHYARGE